MRIFCQPVSKKRDVNGHGRDEGSRAGVGAAAKGDGVEGEGDGIQGRTKSTPIVEM